MMKRALVIGAGFAGLSAATHLAVRGFDVTILEKHQVPGGRARIFQAEGFTFDMGPSWYWMPDVFEQYFAHFGHKPQDFYELVRLDPSYTVVFDQKDHMRVPAGVPALKALFDRYEPGAGDRLEAFLKQAAYKYEVGMNNFVHKPSRSLLEFANPMLLVDMVRLDILKSYSKHVRKYFSHEQLIKLVEFPVLFLGATPANTPALYSMMTYADMVLGTWYPMGGMHEVVKAMVAVAESKGVKIRLGHEVRQIEVEGQTARRVHTDKGVFEADVVVAGADYHHTETKLLSQAHRSYSDAYWESRVMAPSCLIYYLGLNRRIEGVTHHTLFFDEDFTLHAEEIYENPQWPSKPLFYVSVPSKTDPSVAPEGGENVFILIPVAPGLQDTEAVREQYYNMVMDRFEKLTGQPLRDAVVFKRSYAYQDFVSDYHSFRGNAYGLANTLLQTAILKPSLKSKKVDNLYFTGQLTVPGPGVPPSLISGEVVAKEIAKEWA